MQEQSLQPQEFSRLKLSLEQHSHTASKPQLWHESQPLVAQGYIRFLPALYRRCQFELCKIQMFFMFFSFLSLNLQRFQGRKFAATVSAIIKACWSSWCENAWQNSCSSNWYLNGELVPASSSLAQNCASIFCDLWKVSMLCLNANPRQVSIRIRNSFGWQASCIIPSFHLSLAIHKTCTNGYCIYLYILKLGAQDTRIPAPDFLLN